MTPRMSDPVALAHPGPRSTSTEAGRPKGGSDDAGDHTPTAPPQLATPPASESPPDPSRLEPKGDAPLDEMPPAEETSGESPSPRPRRASSSSLFDHLPPNAIPADFLDSALDHQQQQQETSDAYPSPASTLIPPPPRGDIDHDDDRDGAREGRPVLLDKLDERISQAKEQRRTTTGAAPTPTTTTRGLKLDLAAVSSDASNTTNSLPSPCLPTPTSPALPPRPASSMSSRSSRPPSISRRSSAVAATRASPLHTASATFPPQEPRDPKRLSVSSSSRAPSPLPSPHLPHPDPLATTTTTTGTEAMPSSPLRGSSLSRRTSSTHAGTPRGGGRDEVAVDPWQAEVVVRDWAYPPSDPRHLGFPHPDLVDSSGSSSDEDGAPSGSGGMFRRNRRSRNRGSKASRKQQGGKGTSSFRYGQEEGEEEEEDDQGQGLGLGSSYRDGSLGGQRGGGGGGPSPDSRSSFSWGFVTSHSTDFPTSSPASSSVSDDDDDDSPRGYAFNDADHFGSAGAAGGGGGGEFYVNGQHESEIERELGLGPFVPGVYQAVYEFVPELETEMKLSVGEWVSVFERQCAGWVQAGRIVDGVLTEEVGLVPENYLHRLDFEEGEGELVDPEES
ncbi:hypothetical protein JCM3766R1_003570 [Sporobolomyces carnicolor]